ncbi:hypothetical protein D9758_004213 [Tetrapyrgos nigripes]|uniref:Major facilitator superfamily (MFS) profile domain-containing protein n=1 Tax=Tetrapyrgos nigripes TaxID=182062 RepID=A0A8H5LVL5_9AGAR|nr:hypothetical protein D9758_004213 [Tetrapyrgos nigripes]
MMSRPTSLQDTPRSSITYINRHGALEAEILREQSRVKEYGDDDVHDPESYAPTVAESPPPKEKEQVVDWDGPDDPANPQNWSIRRKWLMTILTSSITVNVTFASSAPSAATQRIIEHFGISREVSYLIISIFLIGYMFGPLITGPGSEILGRRTVLCIALPLYTLFILGQALAPNIQTLLITRFFSGFFGVTPLTVGGGILADMWPAKGRGPATSLFSGSVFLGPVLGPLVGGFVAESSLSWEWIFWIMFIFAGVSSLVMIAFLPETYGPVILQKKARRLRKADPVANKDVIAEHEKQDWSFKSTLHRTLYRPFIMLAKEPILVLITTYLSVVYGVLYALFEAFPIIFMTTRGFTISQNGLIFIGVGIGTTIGGYINFRFSERVNKASDKWRGYPPAELRLFGAMVGGPLLVVGSFWLGWTGHYASVHWAAPAVATVVLGCAINLIFMSFLSYLVDTYLMYSASAFAANTIIRSLVGAAFPLFTVQMYEKLGINWASTLVGFIGLLLAPIPFLFFKYGPKIRQHSKFAPCIDLKISKEVEEEEQARQKEAQV